MYARSPRTPAEVRLTRAGVPVAVVLLLTLIGMSAPPDVGAAAQPENQSGIRLLTVGAVLTGGMFQDLIDQFEEETGREVTVTAAGEDIFDRARAGEADIVMAHLGFTELHDFVSDGRGRWPATVLSNTVAFIVPPDDPAGVRSAEDAAEAFRLIAEVARRSSSTSSARLNTSRTRSGTRPADPTKVSGSSNLG